MGAKVGGDMKLYYNTGTYVSPVWVEVTEVGDVTIPDLTRGRAELKRRAKTFSKALPTKIQAAGIEFRLIHGVGSTPFTQIRQDFFAGTTREWAIMEAAINVSGTQGFRTPAFLENFPWDQNLEEVSGHDCRLAVAYHEDPAGTEIDPSWYTVP